jgi:hypothetical protein
LIKLKFIVFIFSYCWCVFLSLPDNSNATEAEKRDMTKTSVNIFSGKTTEPLINVGAWLIYHLLLKYL